jgi:hypothetical protein
MTDIRRAFDTSGIPLIDLFRRPGVGFYIPLYQRDYSWDEENIEQLMEDISRGVEGLVDSSDNIRFLGTVITISEKDKTKIDPRDNRGLPTDIEIVIDGQQRLSTLALLSCLLHDKVKSLLNRLPHEEPYTHLHEAGNIWLRNLSEMHALDLQRGSPTHKPKIIRGQEDEWTYDGPDSKYQSPIASFIARYIRYSNVGGDFPRVSEPLVKKNLSFMRNEVDRIEKAHTESGAEDGNFPTGISLASTRFQEHIWGYEKPELAPILEAKVTDPHSPDYLVSSLAQVFAFCHYFLNCCCVTLIKPTTESWAFDMFQSLNATGTPLTALETFKPLVVQTEKVAGNDYRDSPSFEYFEDIDSLFAQTRTANAKNKLTNDLLTTFALAAEGYKLSNRFSDQRRWLSERYEVCADIETKRQEIKRLADVATYYREVWGGYKGKDGAPLEQLRGHSDSELASVCLLYLSDVNHRIANAVLGRFFANVRNDKPNAVEEFTGAIKAVTAFYTLWRATKSTSGLDNVYRVLMKGRGNPAIGQMCWDAPEATLSVDNLKSYLSESLRQESIGSKEEWLARVPRNLTYKAVKKVCRFCLFVTAHDTIPDPEHPGLMKPGTNGSAPYLKVEHWISADLKEIEHIAPETPNGAWDQALYTEDDYQEIGNLTLLPRDINASVGNRGWLEKLLYYKHLAFDDPDYLITVREEAEAEGITLSTSALDMLQSTKHKHHLKSLTGRDADNDWNTDFVKERSRRIAEIVRDRISPWLLN